MEKICLVACVSRKQSHTAPAEDLYVSPLFKGARVLAKTRFDRWYILSAKYGLLEPDREIQPYNQTLNKMPRKERLDWANLVLGQLINCTRQTDILAFIAGDRYRQFLIPELLKNGYKIEVPLEGLSIGKQLSWFKKIQNGKERLAHLDRFYALLKELEEGVGGKRIMSECTGKMEWPEMGVYFFFEEGETRTTDVAASRVVRVGTHTVSKGSATTLWHRLRNHRGGIDLKGNHRGSIFRLHVGTALIAKSQSHLKAKQSWGRGQVASKEIRASEESLECDVSKYIGKMSLLWLEVPDKPSATSDRAFIEQNAIALISGITGPLDLPSPRWLGLSSSREPIRQSGLWNINHVGNAYDPRFLDVMAEYVKVTLRKKSAPIKSIAPLGWARSRTATIQSELFFQKGT